MVAGSPTAARATPPDLGGTLLKADPMVSTGAPVFEGASAADVMAYFQSLGGWARCHQFETSVEKGSCT